MEKLSDLNPRRLGELGRLCGGTHGREVLSEAHPRAQWEVAGSNPALPSTSDPSLQCFVFAGRRKTPPADLILLLPTKAIRLCGGPGGQWVSDSKINFRSRCCAAAYGFLCIAVICRCSSMAEHQSSKLVTRVRFPSPAPRRMQAFAGCRRRLGKADEITSDGSRERPAVPGVVTARHNTGQ